VDERLFWWNIRRALLKIVDLIELRYGGKKTK
jgi:hypothetical protein